MPKLSFIRIQKYFIFKDKQTPVVNRKLSFDCLHIRILILLLTFAFIISGTTSAQGKRRDKKYLSTDSADFLYGFDFNNQEPDPPTQDTDAKYNDSLAVISALQVLGEFHGCMMDQSINGFGAQKNPEPSPGVFDLSSISPRIQMISNAGGVPVITLVQAPSWMYTGCSNPDTNSYDYPTPQFGAAPCPSHYQDFANLAA